MKDAIVSAASVLAVIVVSVCLGALPFVGHHQTFVGQAEVVTR